MCGVNMDTVVTLSTNIDQKLKEALTDFCKKRGLKIQHFVEKAIIEQLEDEIDLEAYYKRKDEKSISFDKLANE
jgi:regulator of PEP synthase PpsR (kinase-PPPase family)